MEKKKYDKKNLKLETLFGCNTKQLWLYDSTNDVYIDPPAEVLDILDKEFGEEWSQEKENELLEMAEDKPDWLFQTEYWYKDVEV